MIRTSLILGVLGSVLFLLAGCSQPTEESATKSQTTSQAPPGGTKAPGQPQAGSKGLTPQ